MNEKEIAEQIADHHRKLEDAFCRAEKGEVINLTVLMMEAERLHQVLDKLRQVQEKDQNEPVR